MPAPVETTASPRPRTTVDDLLRALETRRTIVNERHDDYLTVRPLAGGAIALFAAEDRVAIAVDPQRAYALETHPAFRCQIPRTPITSYVIVRGEDVVRYLDDVLELALDSLDWRAAPRDALWCARCGVGCGTKRDPCPKCWVEIDNQGRCLCSATEVEP